MQTRIKIKFNTDELRKVLEFVSRMTRADFFEHLKEIYEDNESSSDLRQKARDLIRSKVYGVYEPRSYERTDNLYYSFVTGTGRDQGSKVGEAAELFLYSDPSIAEAKGNNKEDSWSYAAFFLKPVEFDTFIPPRGVKSSPINYRPYFGLLNKIYQNHCKKVAKKALEQSVRAMIPT
jgi:hypothetical protein